MKYTKGLIIISSIFIGAILSIVGTIGIFLDLLKPTGYFFESVMAMSVGLAMLLMVIVANAVGQAIQTFSKVFEKQVEMQEKVNELMQKTHSPFGFGMLGIPSSAMEIDLTNKNINPEELSKLITDIMSKSKTPRPVNKNLDKQIADLEFQLAKAVKEEDFEKAEELSNLLIGLRGKKDSEE